MNILLVNPPNSGRSIPEEEFGITTIKEVFRGEPLALETLAAGLNRHRVEIVDLKVEPEALPAACERLTPDLVGITGVTCEANAMLRIARQAKAAGVKTVVVGGHHASNEPEFFNREPVDYVVVGLGSRTFRELVRALEEGRESDMPWVARVRPGQQLKYDRRPFDDSDVEPAGAPRYDLVARHREEYRLANWGKIGAVVSAMGCTHRCDFCAIPNLTAGRYLVRSPALVARDIAALDTPWVRLVDANSFGVPQRALALGAELRARGLKRRYLADVRADTVVAERGLMRDWKEVGLTGVIVGFEEIDDRRLRRMHKRSTVQTHQEAISILKDLGIMIVGDFIVDPDYTEEDFAALDRFVGASGIDLPILSILTPIPGTPLYQRVKHRIVQPNLDYYTFTNAVLPTRMERHAFYRAYADLLDRFHARLKPR